MNEYDRPCDSKVLYSVGPGIYSSFTSEVLCILDLAKSTIVGALSLTCFKIGLYLFGPTRSVGAPVY